MGSTSEKGSRGPLPNEITSSAVLAILNLLEDKKPVDKNKLWWRGKVLEKIKKDESVEDTKDLWDKLKSMGDKKGLIRYYLQDNHISRMWEKAVGTYIELAPLWVLNDPGVKPRMATAVDANAAAAIKAVLPGTWIGKRGQKKGGWGSFPWAPNSKGFKEEFEMTISNDYSVHIGDIGGEKSKDHVGDIGGEKSKDHVVDIEKLSVNCKVHPVPKAVKSCVAAFTFGDGSNTLTDQITVYIRFAGPTMLVGKAFKANWATNSYYENLWGDLVLAKY